MKIAGIIVTLCTVCTSFTLAQSTQKEMLTTPQKTAGVYYAYPALDIVKQKNAPKGYQPFYISHFGRHGSRYLINDEDYKWILDLLEDAGNQNALTPLGLDVYQRVRKVWQEAEGRGGDLSPLGVRQQRGIAERMFRLYPNVFTNSATLSARSTLVVRCILSMDAFCERLKELNPKLKTNREASNKYMGYLNFHTPEAIAFRSEKNTWKKQLDSFQQKIINPNRLVASLFKDGDFVNQKVKKESLMWGFYWLASDMQNMETKISFYDLFQLQELFDIWQCINAKEYINNASNSFNNNIMYKNAKPVLKNIILSADEVITKKGKGATLRFAHDGNMMPLLAALRLKNCYGDTDNIDEIYKVWSNYKVAPMGANLQIVFYKKTTSDDVIVKFLLNEVETTIPELSSNITPYYRWKDVKAYYQQILDK
ncbi:histidine-type phosphatase [Nubsella zeaxanthinifaciens]|uniref:histidine-type phosphatase n=1 Tax=Nubsella zeaxanthinifaciens TaxID=392412 RepID=UPI003D083BE0